MATLANTIGRGTTAAKPAAGSAGRLYYDTTLSKLQRDSGTAWEDVAEVASVTFNDAEGDPANVAAAAADGTSAYPSRRDHAHAGMGVLISSQILGAAAASVTFSSIPATYKGLLIYYMARGDAATDIVEVWLRCNSDTAANYDSRLLQTSGTGAAASGAFAATYVRWGWITGNTSPAGAVGQGDITIQAHAGTTYHKSMIGGGWFRRDAATNAYVTVHGGNWRSTVAITSLTLLPGSGNFAAGSEFSLYGVN